MCEQFEIREPLAVCSFGLNQQCTFNTIPAFGFCVQRFWQREYGSANWPQHNNQIIAPLGHLTAVCCLLILMKPIFVILASSYLNIYLHSLRFDAMVWP